MHDDTQLQQVFAQAGRLDAADRARLIGLLVEQVPWGRLARDEQRTFVAELEAFDRGQLRELAEGQWLALTNVEARLARVEEELARQKGYVEDLTARLEEKLKVVKRDSLFLAHIRHCLTEPLWDLIALARWIEQAGDGTLNADQEGLRQRMIAQAEHARDLVEQLIDYPEIEWGGPPGLEIQHFDLAPVIEKVYETVKGFRQLEFVLEIEDDLPPVRADRLRVRQILLYLAAVLNAQEVPGRVTFAATRDAGHVRVGLLHPGVFIPQDQHSLLIERVDGVAGLYDFDPTGELTQWLIFGRHLARLMEGDLWLENLPAKSTAFYLTLPAVL